MNTEDGIKILSLMKSYGKQGVSIIRLSKETEVSISDLRLYIKKHPDFFVKVGNKDKYVLNHFGKYQGQLDSMIKVWKVENDYCLKKQLKSLLLIIIFLLLILMSTGTVSI